MIKSNVAYRHPQQSCYDVVIVGGAKIGSSIAWFLTHQVGFNGSILVVERDLSYEFSSTAHTNSCMRQQFSSEVNVRISQFAADYVNNFQAHFDNDERVPAIHFESYGYMYLADNPEFAQTLRESQAAQQRCGAATQTLSAQEIQQAYPFYNLDDIICGNHNLVNEGYYDGNTVFAWWQRSAREKGVEYLNNEVVAMSKNVDASQVTSVTLATGEQVNCGCVVNASGPRAARTARMLDIELPVEPRKRYTYIFQAEQPLSQALPLTIDPSGVHMRSDGSNYLAGCPPDIDPAVDYDDFIEDHHLWQDKVWPAIAHRIPQFEAIKLIQSWVGHYAYNTFDQNVILGSHTELHNFFFANGFSGHGFQQAPAVGRAIAELICFGEYRSLDLSALNYQRIVDKQPFIEQAVI